MRSVMNLDFGEFYREHRYINCAKSGQRVVNSGAGTTYWLNIDSNFYPTTLSNPISFTIYIPESGTYVVRWLGTGSFTATSFAARSNSSSGVYTGGGASGSTVTNGRMTFVASADDTSSNVTITSDGTMTDFVICRLDEESLLDAGEIFRPAFISKLQSFNPYALRFMDGQSTNRSTLRNWSDRPSVNQITYHNQQFVRANIVGDNGSGVGVIVRTDTGSSDSYAAAAYSGMPVAYEHGEIIHGRVDASNTYSSGTLNVGGRGAKTLVNEYNSALNPAGNSQERLTAGGPRTFVYDANYDRWYFNNEGAFMGHPIEMMVSLCNKASLAGWFCIPPYASDDFVTQFANYLVANYQPSTILIEYANEIWNSGSGFPMTTRMAKWGDVTFSGIGSGSGANYSGWYGYRMAQIAAIMRPIFSSAGQSSKLKIVLACQGAQGDSVSNITNVIENNRFQNASFAALSGASAPILSADYVSYALYYSGNSFRWLDSQWTSISANVPTLVTHVDNYLSGDSARIKTAFDWARDDFLASGSTYAIISAATGRYANYNNLAASYGKQVVHYEHNHEIDAPSTSWASGSPISDSTYGGQAGKINQFILAFLASSQYGQVVSTYVRYFGSLSNSLATSIFGMCTANPWLTFAKKSPTTETSIGGSSIQSPYQNWKIHALSNGRKRRIVVRT